MDGEQAAIGSIPSAAHLVRTHLEHQQTFALEHCVAESVRWVEDLSVNSSKPGISYVWVVQLVGLIAASRLRIALSCSER